MQPRKGPHGLHFFDRKSGINFLFDEVVLSEREWSVAPRTLSVALSNACDCVCPHCFAPKTDDALTATDVLGWAKELDEAGGQSIGFGGGEPTIYPGIAELCRATAEGTSLSVTLTTHGQNFSDKLAATLRGAVHFIRVSLGGLGETYESVHGRPFSRLVQCLPELRETAPLGFNFLLNSRTVPRLDEMAHFACENGALEILLLPEVSSNGQLQLTRAEQNTLATWIHRNENRLPLAMSVIGCESIPTTRLPIEDPRGPSYDFMHVDAAGRLRQSAFGGSWVRISSSGLIAAVEEFRRNDGTYGEDV